MRLLRLAPVVALLAFAPAAWAQLPPTNNAAFAPLDLPAPNAYRAADGRPGPAYWQNRADYEIAVALDTTAHRVAGTVTIRYTNNSPLPLDHLWLQLEQNLFRPDSRGTALLPAGSRWRGAFAEGGYTLGEVTVGYEGVRYAPQTLVDDTRMKVDLREPLAANGGQLSLTIPYSFISPEYGADRMGRFEAGAGTVYEFAQWYPKMFVYDDVNGWNAMPYLGQGEFYLEYGTFDVALTVPANMVVVATGEVTNAEEVYTAAQREALARAATSDTRVYIIGPDQVGRALPGRSGTATWRFHAENVRDFAWAASRAFMLDAASVDNSAGRRVLVMSAYPAEGLGDSENPGWEHATMFNRHTIGHYSAQWFPYPYPAAISVAGVVGGMEYPGIQFSGVDARGFDLFAVVDHELGHNWYPMIVGNDERRYAWMDEGFNTFTNVLSNLAYYNGEDADPAFGRGQGTEAPYVQATRSSVIVGMMQSPIADQPIMTYPDQQRGQALGVLAYFKPAAGLLLLRDHVLGPERFDAAFREYTRRWAFKHPQPADFFRTIEDVSGEDLDWFWRGWFFSSETFDVAVASVDTGDGASVIAVENRGGLVFPIEAEVTFTNGRSERVRLPAEAFYKSDRATVSVAEGDVASVRLDPDGELPDTDRANDTWSARGTR
ncbi:MAG TPA: M1 family metallopeptidase [Rubricoccaceae bacterium]|nr:M1 family metallopeptidase [Rubricoccaceae bacterium]